MSFNPTQLGLKCTSHSKKLFFILLLGVQSYVYPDLLDSLKSIPGLGLGLIAKGSFNLPNSALERQERLAVLHHEAVELTKKNSTKLKKLPLMLRWLKVLYKSSSKLY